MNFIFVKSVFFLCNFGVLIVTAQSISPNGRIMNDVDIPNMSTRIAGGTAVAAADEFPFMASVRAVPGDTLCGGTLISTTVVLTAASCIFGSTTIIVGLDSINVVDTQTVTNYTIHPLYNPGELNNNIGLIPLNTATTTLNPIPLFTGVTADFTGVITRVLGWGQASTNGPMQADLQWAEKIPILNTECANIYGNALITDSVICARGPTTNSLANACEGDIGGPLILFQNNVWIQIGVVSFVSSRGCTFGDPTVYTRISAYVSWISQVTGIPIR